MLTELLSSFTMAGVWVTRACDDDVEVVDGVGVNVCIGESMKQSNEHCNS